jgi:Dockerin type I domain
VFGFSDVDYTGTIVAGAACSAPVPDADGGGVTVGCRGSGPTVSSGLLATLVLTPLNMGCSTMHLVMPGAPDNGGAAAGSYTTDAVTLAPQSNAYVDGAADWVGDAGCAPDSDGDGYPDALDPSPDTYCTIMRADVNGDGVVSILDITAMASQFLQHIPPGSARYDQNFDHQIDILDLTIAANSFDKRVSACP